MGCPYPCSHCKGAVQERDENIHEHNEASTSRGFGVLISHEDAMRQDFRRQNSAIAAEFIRGRQARMNDAMQQNPHFFSSRRTSSLNASQSGYDRNALEVTEASGAGSSQLLERCSTGETVSQFLGRHSQHALEEQQSLPADAPDIRAAITAGVLQLVTTHLQENPEWGQDTHRTDSGSPVLVASSVQAADTNTDLDLAGLMTTLATEYGEWSLFLLTGWNVLQPYWWHSLSLSWLHVAGTDGHAMDDRGTSAMHCRIHTTERLAEARMMCPAPPPLVAAPANIWAANAAADLHAVAVILQYDPAAAHMLRPVGNCTPLLWASTVQTADGATDWCLAAIMVVLLRDYHAEADAIDCRGNTAMELLSRHAPGNLTAARIKIISPPH